MIIGFIVTNTEKSKEKTISIRYKDYENKMVSYKLK